jgi:hypothetical protein
MPAEERRRLALAPLEERTGGEREEPASSRKITRNTYATGEVK